MADDLYKPIGGLTIQEFHLKRYIQHKVCEAIVNKLLAHYSHDANLSPSEFNETNEDGTKSRYRMVTMASWEMITDDDDGLDTLPPVKLKLKLYYSENRIPNLT